MNCIIFFKGFRGEAYDGVNILEKSLESVRKEVERYAFASLQSTIHDVLLCMSTTWVCRCDQFLGTCLVHSVAGGTGSGTVQCPDSPESTLTAPSANARPSVSANTIDIDIDIRPSRRLRLAARGGAARRVPAGVPALSSGGAEPSDVRLADAALQRGALSRSTRPVRAFCCCSSIRRDTCCSQCSHSLQLFGLRSLFRQRRTRAHDSLPTSARRRRPHRPEPEFVSLYCIVHYNIHVIRDLGNLRLSVV